MTDPIKTLEALRKPVTGNGPERDTAEAWNNALEAARGALEQSGIYGPFTPITVSGRSEPIAEADMRCAECDCDNPPYGCNWIKPGPLADPVGVKVKPLVWEEDEYWRHRGMPPVRFGKFCMNVMQGGNGGWYIAGLGGSFDTPEAAKAAAQADYERRILSALEPGPTLAEAYRAGLEAAAERAWRDSGPTLRKAIRSHPVPSEFGGE